MNSSLFLRSAIVLCCLGTVGSATGVTPAAAAGPAESVLMPDMRTTDLNGNGATDLADFSVFAATLIACGGMPAPVCDPGDYNCDGIAGLADLGIFAANYFAGGVFAIKCPPAAAPAARPTQEP
ncbi:MAG: hypothetical protein ACREOU_11755 [Candidatus Eiseniibacteriota bacterium]